MKTLNDTLKINRLKKFCKQFVVFQMALMCGYTAAHTVNTSINAIDFTKTPAIIADSATPLVMLALSNDHQLYFKLYTDWDDLDDSKLATPDGAETTYKHSIDYYGYFDSYKCYEYDNGNGRFKPKSITADKYCNGNVFSGNFLNWSSMTRIDAIRKVLYGGARVVDTTTLTVLERSYLPTEAHSFAKHYAAADIDKLTPWNKTEVTICNTTYDSGSGLSKDTTNPPLIRFADGDFRFWSSNEVWQCTWDSERGDNYNKNPRVNPIDSDPNKTTDGLGLGDYIARVEVCDSTLLGTENCKIYDDGGTNRYKPIGLLQTYGESGAVDFGLITGSYQKNKSGGVVRKNISTFTDEVNTNTGQFTGTNGIISSIDKFRISQYSYNGSTYRFNNCNYGVVNFPDGDCVDWGNPFSEIYLESVRYFAGLTKSAAFDADDSSYINGLTDVNSWIDPLAVDNRCASCNIVVINASDISYDSDGLSMAGLPSSPSAAALTKTVGDKEGITGGRYFVGESGAANDQLCTPKTVNDLGVVKGTCPNAPRLEGTFNIAGISHWAHTEDIRTDLADMQTVNTYAIALAPSTPSIIIPHPDTLTNTIATILPACRMTSRTPNGNCAIVDFKIISQDVAGGTGQIWVSWEDSEQGGDFDMDFNGIISYALSADRSSITVTTDVLSAAAGFTIGFAYIIAGTTDDGWHAMAGHNNFTYDDPALPDSEDCRTGCNTGDAPRSRTFSIGNSGAKLLNDPLWYTAKYGGFNDLDGDKDPNEADSKEWDLKDLSGNAGSDGIPDNYFPVFNPAELEARMKQVFTSILNRVSAGNAAAVVSKTASGVGAVYQAIYQPLIKDGLKEVKWSGYVHGMFIDDNGLLREDTDADGLLDGYTADRIVDIFFNASAAETQIQRYTSVDGGATKVLDGLAVSLHSIKPIWSAHEVMSTITDSAIKVNRTYDPSLSTNGRFMYTWIDDASGGGTKGVVDAGEVIPFVASNFDSTTNNYRYLNVSNPDDGLDDGNDAGDIINFVRGVTNIPGQRNRIIDYDKDGTEEKLRIGDIIHSTPAAVGAPHDGYNVVYSDSTYRDFVNQYSNRRQVVYVGSNNGVIHAFNSGFWSNAKKGFLTDPANTVPHEFGLPLGAELWGYVPMNILPHLKWLPDVDYPHVYYIDAEPVVFDAKIFPVDADHPHGWGTVLVVGMRLGGGTIDLDIDGDNNLTRGDPGDITTRSAYVVMDVTNPEVAPTLMAEITDVNLNYTLSRPDVVTMRAPIAGDFNTGVNNWYLVFGSGPDNLSGVESSQSSRSYLWNLATKSFVSGYDGSNNGAAAAGFTGDYTSIDWDLDGKDDNVYFGTDETSSGTLGGRMQRMVLDGSSIASSTVSTVINPVKPMLNKPLTVRQGTNQWVFLGSGRLFTIADTQTANQESFYGIQEDASSPSKTFILSDLQNVTGVDVYTQGYIEDTGGVISGEPAVTDASGYRWLENLIDAKDGWFYNMKTTPAPAAKNLGNAISINKLLAYTVYSPTANLCNAIGSTSLRINCLATGTACGFSVLGTTNTVKGDKSIDEVHFVNGLVTDISTHFDKKGNPTVIGHGQHGDIHSQSFLLPPFVTGRQSWREIIEY